MCVHKGGGAASGRFPVNIDLCDSSVNDFIACDETRVEQEESPTPQDFYFFKSQKKNKPGSGSPTVQCDLKCRGAAGLFSLLIKQHYVTFLPRNNSFKITLMVQRLVTG